MSAPAKPRGRLFRKYALLMAALVSGALVINGGIELYFSYRENRAALIGLQREKARAAAVEIANFVREIEGQIGWTTYPVFGTESGVLEQRRIDFIRVLRNTPPITELQYLDAQGREQMRVSRLAMDVIGSNKDLAAEPRFKDAKAKRVYRSAVYFHKESEPYLTLAVASSGRGGGVTVAEVNLKLIWDVVSRIQVGKGGRAYVVDQEGRLIAHPDISHVLRKTDMSQVPQVMGARAGAGAPAEGLIVKDLEGREVLSTHAPIPTLNWIVFAEVPVGEALAPLYESATRTAILLFAGVLLAVLVGLLFARRMASPIRELRVGAGKIGAGDLSHRIAIKSGDELQALGQEFNEMAGRLRESYATLEQKVETRTQELSESLERQTATSEVLGVISRSTSKLQPVLDAIVETAARLCQADWAVIFKAAGDGYEVAAFNQATDEWAEYLTNRGRLKVTRGAVTGRAILERRTVHVPDILADSEFTRFENQRIGNFRTVLAVPLLREGVPTGVVTLFRSAVRPFDDKQIELVSTFADQAVIAIENVRLFDEVQARTKELTESLERQTATSEVLTVISRSTSQLQPVLDAIVATAARLCRAAFATLFKLEDGKCRLVAANSVNAELADFLSRNPPSLDRGTVIGRVVLDRRTIHIPDVLADPEFTYLEAQKLGKFRTLLGVPLLREGEPIGALSIGLTEVQPFTDKQIELITTFADQAVIAIENVRLFDEVQARTRALTEALEQLRGLMEVSETINSSIDLATVLRAVLENACRLADAGGGAIYVTDPDSEFLRLESTHGMSDQVVAAIKKARLSARGHTIVGRAIGQRRPEQVADLSTESAEPLRDALLAAGIRAVLAVPLFREEKIVGALVVRRKRAGAFDERTIDLLEAFGQQSALAIENARLFQEIEDKGRALEIASQHKSQFLANMSHELRTPLNAILGYTELIRDSVYGEISPRVRGVLERVEHNGRHLLGLINDVLDISKIEAGRLELSMNDYSLRDVVASVVVATESLASEKRLALKTEVADNLPHGHGDERRLAQVLLNLVGNAIKFTERGEVRIAARAEGDRFEIAVVDTGPGIPRDQRDKIFEQFHQVDTSSTRTKGGTGLGLAISKQMVVLHGGRIWVESELGKGSTFRISLPVAAERQKEAA